MDYWELRKIIAGIVPRAPSFLKTTSKVSLVKEKGRKTNYYQFDVLHSDLAKKERLLNVEEMKSFIEISLRSQACPFSLNVDVYDSKRCAYGCRDCYADFARASLYSSFFDNTKGMGTRVCSPEYFKTELDELFKHRGSTKEGLQDVPKAISMGMPIRLGIRFEDFIRPVEKKKRASLALLNYLADNEYPVMINTKSDMVGDDEYVEALSRNKAKSAVHVTIISSDEKLLKKLEPGAPTFAQRIKGCKNMSEAGIRVVARIEPFMTFLTDEKDQVDDYISQILDAGIRHITLDSYSYSAASGGIKNSFVREGYDFDRMYLIMSQCQWLGSLLLGKFMEYLRSYGLSCSTFDAGNVPSNDDPICCEVGEYFGMERFCMGNTTSAMRFIVGRGSEKTTWEDYISFVEKNGGFLSNSIRTEVRQLWNLTGDTSFSLDWAAGLRIAGSNSEGLIWTYDKTYDDREKMLGRII